MISTDAQQTTVSCTYEVCRHAWQDEATLIHVGDVGIRHYVSQYTAAHEGKALRIVSDLWLGRRVADLGTELVPAKATYETFQPKAYDAAAARRKVGGAVLMMWALTAVVLLNAPQVVAVIAFAGTVFITLDSWLPARTFETVTHDVQVNVPVEVAYYIDPTLPSPRTWGGPSYTVVRWDDGREYLDPLKYFDYRTAAVAEDECPI